MRAFVRDFLGSFVAVAIPMLLAGWIVDLLPWPRFELSTFLPALAPLHLVYLVPIGLLVFGLRTRNLGIIAGVLISGVALYLWLAQSLLAQRNIIRDLEAAATAPAPNVSTRTLILPNGHCDGLCIQILATSDYRVAVPEWPAWEIYRRAEGDACEQENAWPTRLRFLTRGYLGMCAATTKSAATPDGVVIAEYKLAGKGNRADDIEYYPNDWSIVEHPWGNAFTPVGRFTRDIPGFVGELYERSIRIDGQEHLLERRFHGALASAAELLTFSLAPGPAPLGEDFDRAAFYTRALGLPLSNARRPGPAKLDALFEALERPLAAAPKDLEVLDDRAVFALGDAFGVLARDARIDEAAIVRSHIQRAVQSQRAPLVDAGLYAMAASAAKDPVEAEAIIGRLLESNNPALVANALRKARYHFGIVDRPQIQRRVLEIPFRIALFAKDSSLTKHPPSAPVPSPQNRDEAYRKRAADYLRSAAYLIPGHCEILLSIIAQGDDKAASKRDALDALLATRPAVFSACTLILDRAQRSDLFGSMDLTDGQIAALRDRADLVPAAVLLKYWRRFLSSERGRAMSDDRIIALIQARLSLARQFHHLEKRDLRTLDALLEILTNQ